MPCLAPSLVINPVEAAAFGLIAERFIGRRYLANVRRSAFFPASTKDFQDISVGFGNVTLFIAFLKANNPGLSTSQILALRVAPGLVRVPDLMTDDRGVREEFYEIKPNSPDGVVAGLAKVAALDALLTFVSLSKYTPGRAWSPNERVRVFTGSLFGRSIQADFHFFRRSAGLVVYELCVEGELVDITLEVLIAILLIIIVLILSGGTIPVPVPVPA
jgi:hypothetical protein